MKKHGKKFREVAKKITHGKLYPLAEGIKLATETSAVRFDATVEIHINTGTDPKHADQMIRSMVVMPHGTGKSKKIAVFCDSSLEKDLKNAGADIVGDDDLIEKVSKGEIDFDIALAQPAMMKKLAKIAKVIGPKGLMPSPKGGTVTDDLVKAVTEVKKGKIEFKNDKTGIVHSVIGKVSFGENKLLENCQVFIKTLKDAKPSGVKGSFIQDIYITTSMGPSVKIDLQSALN